MMRSMCLPPVPPSEPRRLVSASGPGRRALRPSRARTLCAGALTLLAAVALPRAMAHAQPLPQGYTSDVSVTPQETSRPTSVSPVQDTAETQGPSAGDEYADTDPSALVEFQQPLADYGTWIDDPTYGTVWVPSAAAVGSDFAPYVSGGRWAMTEDGEWLWVSDYEWGYIPFHYGRWIWISTYGWSWIPGRVYAPAWVVWRTGDHGYIGWAPMPPAFYWSSGVAVSFWGVPTAAYVFCPTTYVFHEHVTTYVVHDRATVHRAAVYTRPYRPARPSGSSAVSAPPSRSSRWGGGARSSYRPASPSLVEAGVHASAAPKWRASPEERAIAYSRKSTTPRARAMSSEAHGLQRGSSIDAHRPVQSSQAPGARPRRPDAGGASSLGHVDRPSRTPSTPSPVFRTPASGGRAAEPSARTPRAPSSGQVAPRPQAASPTTRSSVAPRGSSSPQHHATPAPKSSASSSHKKK